MIIIVKIERRCLNARKAATCFFRSVKTDSALLDETASYEHSLLTLIRASMQEQKDTLNKLIPELEIENKARDLDVRNYITIVYHNHEVSSPVFRAWGRANEWMNLSSKETFNTERF
ncbi:hypothetical protein [Bacillus sp. OV322]|uniref:hypothetical protein n=1 Tax=Bacillus sp. OV322 TaxID=1882764 RepID=UPI00114D436F|nr:hypothetical protein [Bacillus sp. OV322]